MIQSEIDAINSESGLHRETPYIIANVSKTQFSVARWAGGCTYQGERYFYDPVNDELVRHDVLRWIATRRKEKHRSRVKEEAAKQITMEV